MPASVVYGQAASFTATVTGFGTPSGTVVFYKGAVNTGDEIGSAALAIVGGQDQAAVSDSALAVTGSPYAITAVYSGDANNQAGTSSAQSVAVTQAATATAIAPGSATVSFGQSATFTATVSSSAGTPPDGSVQFLVNGVAYGSTVPLAGASAQLAISEPAGAYTITAQYTGDANYAPTLSGAETGASLTVNQAVSAATNLAINPDTGISTSDGVTDTGTVTLTGSLSTTGLTVDVFDTTTNQDLGDATVSGTSFSMALNLAEGSHALRVRSILSGSYADAFFTVLVDLTKPSSHVDSLGTPQSTDSFPVTVAFSDPTGSGGAPASGVVSVGLYVSVNGGVFSLNQTQTFSPTTSGTVTFTFNGQDRNTYAFHSIAIDAAGNTESKNPNLVEASTYVPDLNPPVTHVLSSNPSYSWSPFSSSEFSGLTPSSYNSTTGVFTLNWAGADPDQNSGTPPGSIALVDVYVQVDGGSATLVGQLNGGTPNSNGVYTGSVTYTALADDKSHTYAFYSVGIDDEQKVQYAPAAGPSSPDVSFTETYSAPLAVSSFVVEQSIAERSYIRYLNVYFNDTTSTSPALQALASGLAGSSPTAFVELEWYGENVTSATSPLGSVTLFNSGSSYPAVSLSGNDLSIDFGTNGITNWLSGKGVSGTGPTTKVGDGWYALGIDATGNPTTGPTFWVTFFRLLGDAEGTGVVTGPYTTAGTDAYVVYHAEGESGSLLNADVNGDGVVNSKDYQETVLENGQAVGTGPKSVNFPQFQLIAGAAAGPGGVVPITQVQVQALIPSAIAAWEAAGLDAADVRLLESVPVQIGDLGMSTLGEEAAGTITINRTAAGYNWYVGAGSPSGRAFGQVGTGGEAVAGPGSAAAGRVDLLTVLEHELGHVLGLPDNAQAGDLMDITLGPGVRRSPSALDVGDIAPLQSNLALSLASRASYDVRAHLLPYVFTAMTIEPATDASQAATWAAESRPGVARIDDENRRRPAAAVAGAGPNPTVDAALASIMGPLSGDRGKRQSLVKNDSSTQVSGPAAGALIVRDPKERGRQVASLYRRRSLAAQFNRKDSRKDRSFPQIPEPSER